MSGAWDFLAGFAGTLGGQLQKRQEDERAEKLRKMQEEAAMKRDMFLAEFRAGVEEKSRAAEHERTKNDVTAQFTNPETGEVFGRTKSGETVPLSTTTEEYKQSLRDTREAEVELKRARQEASEASAARSRRPPTGRSSAPKEPKPDPIHKEIRKAYADEVKRLREAGEDAMSIDSTARANLYPMYGGENVQNSLGGGAQSVAKPLEAAAAPTASASPPGTSKDNPIPAQSLKSEPPAGTWVLFPSGRVAQTGS